MKFSREVYFNPAYDRRSKDPKRNYGIHGVTLVMFLKGDKGAVNFTLYTNWNLPHVTKELLNRPSDEYSIRAHFLPQPAEVMYHSPVPMYEGHTATTNTCEHIGGVPCYSDFSCLAADQFYQALLEEGSEGVWLKLEEYYYDNFGKEESDK